MDTTFISIHDLTSQARLLYSSDSVIDILGYTPDELIGRSCWDFFPFEQLPYAKEFHRRKVTLDKAAVLVYCRVRSKYGEWVGCECCFTIVYDVMIVCTSRYRQDERSHDRAMAAPIVRRLFSSSPRDPRYHMLSHLSSKFSTPSDQAEHEPRAALFLNRFTRSLTIMYATDGIKDIIGIPAEIVTGTSFYYCVAENCLGQAVKCLENAKGNHSIAYLRFWYRDPSIGQHPNFQESDETEEETSDEEMAEAVGNDGGAAATDGSAVTAVVAAQAADPAMDIDQPPGSQPFDSRASSGDSGHKKESAEAIFDNPQQAESSSSSIEISPTRPDGHPQERAQGQLPDQPQAQPQEQLQERPQAYSQAQPQQQLQQQLQPLIEDPLELEAVISCASDGLVVCLRKARPLMPHPTHRPGRPVYPNGLFAAPWAAEPYLPPISQRSRAGFGSGFAPALGPTGARHSMSGPRPDASAIDNDFMAAIREQAIFAWALTGINGALAEFGRGQPDSGSQPEGGLKVWESDQNTYAAPAATEGASSSAYPHGYAVAESSERARTSAQLFGDPGLSRQQNRGPT